MNQEKKDKLLLVLFYIFVVILAVIIVSLLTMWNLSMFYMYASAPVVTALATLCFLLTAWIPVRERATRVISDEFFEDCRNMTIAVSMHIVSRKPFKILIDGKKVAEICRGKELQIRVPMGIHEMTTFQYEHNKSTKKLNFDNNDSVFIWICIKMNPVPIQITPLLGGNRTLLEEKSRVSNQGGMRIIKTIFVLSFLLASVLWLYAILYM